MPLAHSRQEGENECHFHPAHWATCVLSPSRAVQKAQCGQMPRTSRPLYASATGSSSKELTALRFSEVVSS